MAITPKLDGTGLSQVWAKITEFFVKKEEGKGLVKLYNDTGNSTDGTMTQKSISDKLSEIDAIVKGRNMARVFTDTESMYNWLSDPINSGAANVGDNLYIVELDVSDYWISRVLTEPNEHGHYYEIAPLEYQKIDLTTLKNVIGTTDISGLGDGTLTGIVENMAAVDVEFNGRINIIETVISTLSSPKLLADPKLTATIGQGVEIAVPGLTSSNLVFVNVNIGEGNLNLIFTRNDPVQVVSFALDNDWYGSAIVQLSFDAGTIYLEPRTIHGWDVSTIIIRGIRKML